MQSFKNIVTRNHTFVDKTLLVAEFLEDNASIVLVLRPRRFGKSVNLSMLRDFFYIPIAPDSKECRESLFKDSNIMTQRRDLVDEHFCKYPVIYIDLKVMQ